MAGFGGSVKLTGESEYRKALKEITSNLKLVSSELKLTNTEFSTGDKSVKQAKTSYDSMNKSVQDQKSKIAELKSTLAQMTAEYGADNEKVKQFKTQLNNAENQLKTMESETDKSTKELKNMKNGFDDAGKGAISFGDILKANVLGDAIVGGIKAIGSAVAEVGKAFINMEKQALDSYAEFEQLEGGVKKIFGDEMASEVINNANRAFKTANLSANEYMDTVTSFSAPLINSLGGDTKKAISYADQAIQDMSDNANTFGTDISMIQSAYQGFAKQNYTMLDNLKLGYGGTKTEMQRLLSDAEKISGIKYDISSFSDITQAIHVMQQEMGIAGTTAKEAGTTIQGSVNSMKSAWDNLLTSLASGEDLEGSINDMVESIFGDGSESNLGVFGNVLPVIETIVTSFSNVVPTIAQRLTENMPALLNAGINLIQNLINGIQTALPQLLPIVTTLVGQVSQFIVTNLPLIIDAGIQILMAVVQGFGESLPELIPVMIDAILTIVDNLLDNIDMVIDAGIQLLIGLTEGLIEALPILIEKVPTIIEKLVTKLTDPEMIGKLVYAAGVLIGKLAVGLIQAIPQLVSKIPQIISSIQQGLSNGVTAMGEVGKNLLKGLWEGMSGLKDWLWNKVKGMFTSLTDKIKNFFGIHSPSKLFQDEIGTNLALGIGEGFTDTMADVTDEMQSSMPTEFDLNTNTTNSVTQSNSNSMLETFKQALSEMKIELDDEVAGRFVDTTVSKLIYT